MRMRASPKYVIISPCRDEAAFMRRTLESVKRQSVPPDLWVVVDDGSTDETPAILEQYARELPYLRVVRRENRGRRSVGPGVIEAFYAGYRTIEPREFDYVCKLDLDLDLPPAYFESLMQRMEVEPRLGTCSGKPYFANHAGRLVSERCGDEMSVGMSKFYRTECFLEIGGFVPHVMWDGIDCHRCRMANWSARSFDDFEVRFVHLRPMGSSDKSMWNGRWRHGTGQWFMGTGLAYMTASALYRSTRPPLIVGGMAMWLGYVASMLAREPRYPDLEFRAVLRRFQSESLLLGKRRASRRCEARRMRANGSGPNSTPAPREIDLEGVRLDALSEKQCVEHVVDAISAGRGGWIVTPNLDHLRRLARDDSFREHYRRADLAVADGMPLVWACRLQRTPLPGRVAGSDLIWSLCGAAAEREASVFLLGGDPGTADEAAQKLRARFAGLRVVGTACPEPGFEKRAGARDAIAACLVAAQPDIVFVALGSPKQEELIGHLRAILPSAWWLGCGISFSFVAGRVQRAPVWLRRLGLEWVHRMAQEPRRLAGRYLVDGVPFGAGLLVRSALRGLRVRVAY
jgi:exopolysaccharide biosynthesis WecB/TagA/CpsF family protein